MVLSLVGVPLPTPPQTAAPGSVASVHMHTRVNTHSWMYTCAWTQAHIIMDTHGPCVDTGTHNRGYTRVDTHMWIFTHMWTHMHTQAGYTHSELQIQGWAAP